MGKGICGHLFHAHRSRRHNMTKQTRFPTIWGEHMNGQSAQVADWFSSVSTFIAVILGS